MYVDYPYLHLHLQLQPQQQQPQQTSPVTHVRNGSESSTMSTSSTTSTITPSSAKSSKDKRFVRYVMNTTQSKSANNQSNKWNMSNVILWLDVHNFNQSWKDTFKRNEISGNRFLELCNYDSDSMIWKQFGKFLNLDNDFNTIQRFISLLKSESEMPTLLPDERQNSIPTLHSRNGSNDSLSSSHLLINLMKAENRKSTPIFHKHKSSNGSIGSGSTPTNSSSSASFGTNSNSNNSSNSNSSTTMTNIGNINVHGNSIKQRPFSYITPSSTSTSQAKKEQQPYKFFRKHYRSSSNDANQILEREFSSTPNSALSSSSHELPGSSTKKKERHYPLMTSTTRDLIFTIITRVP